MRRPSPRRSSGRAACGSVSSGGADGVAGPGGRRGTRRLGGVVGAPTVSGVRRSDHPNIIFYVIDGAGADLMSLYGYNRRTTPNLERPTVGGARRWRSGLSGRATTRRFNRPGAIGPRALIGPRRRGSCCTTVKGGTKLDQMAEENQTTWPLGRVSENGCAKGGVRMVERQRRGGRACCVRDDSCRRSAPGCGRDESADRAARQSAVRSRRSRSIR